MLNREVGFALNNGHRQPRLAGPKSANPPSIDQSILSPSDLTTGSQKMTASARTLRKLSASNSGVPSKPISISICR